MAYDMACQSMKDGGGRLKELVMQNPCFLKDLIPHWHMS
jgi:hypothetical protein